MKALKLATKFSNNNLIQFNIARFSDKFRDKELAEERFYFDKEESNFLFLFLGRLAQKLLKKLKSEPKQIDEQSLKSKEKLLKIVENHKDKFSSALVDDLLKWRTQHH